MKKYTLVILSLLLTSFSFATEHLLSDLRIPFEEGMWSNKFYDENFATKNKNWVITRRLYETHILDNLTFSNQPTIPLIIHHIWVGSSLPQYARDFRKTWVDQHPGWTFILWTDYPSQELGEVVLNSYKELQEHLEDSQNSHFIIMDMKKVRLINHTPFQEAKNYGAKSDILRYEILWKFGGLYVDTDFECIRPFDDFHYCCDFYTGINNEKNLCLMNGLIGAKPKSKILKRCIRALSKKNYSDDTLSYSGPYYFTRCFLEKAEGHKEKCVAFPPTYFYPWPHTSRDQPYEETPSWIRKETFGMHYWKVSWAQ